MHSLLWPVGSVFAVGAGVFAFVHGFRALCVQQLIRNTPATKVRSLAFRVRRAAGHAPEPQPHAWAVH